MVYKYKQNFKKHSYPAYFLSYILKTIKIIDFRGNSCLKILNLYFCYVFYTSFYLMVMPTKKYTIRYASIDKLVFFLMLSIMSDPLTAINRRIPLNTLFIQQPPQVGRGFSNALDWDAHLECHLDLSSKLFCRSGISTTTRNRELQNFDFPS